MRGITRSPVQSATVSRDGHKHFQTRADASCRPASSSLLQDKTLQASPVWRLAQSAAGGACCICPRRTASCLLGAAQQLLPLLHKPTRCTRASLPLGTCAAKAAQTLAKHTQMHMQHAHTHTHSAGLSPPGEQCGSARANKGPNGACVLCNRHCRARHDWQRMPRRCPAGGRATTSHKLHHRPKHTPTLSSSCPDEKAPIASQQQHISRRTRTHHATMPRTTPGWEGPAIRLPAAGAAAPGAGSTPAAFGVSAAWEGHARCTQQHPLHAGSTLDRANHWWGNVSMNNQKHSIGESNAPLEQLVQIN
jgi:hypothetical protein